MLTQIKRYWTNFFPDKEKAPRIGYDIWAMQYDNQPGNLMLDLDAGLFNEFLDRTVITGKVVMDIGCGTGRHWKKIMDKKPEKLIGFDVSAGMLKKLQEKFPLAKTFCLENNFLPGTKDRSADIIISTLTVAHIENIESALREWNRVLQNGGEILITDYHPELLAKGGKRTFKNEGKLVAIKNHIHTTERIRAIAKQLGWEEIHFTERRIDDSMKQWYERQNALPVFEKFKGVAVIYALHLKKKSDTA